MPEGSSHSLFCVISARRDVKHDDTLLPNDPGVVAGWQVHHITLLDAPFRSVVHHPRQLPLRSRSRRGASRQLSVLAMGLMSFDHFHPGLKVPRPNVCSGSFATFIPPFPSFLVSSGLLMDFLVNANFSRRSLVASP